VCCDAKKSRGPDITLKPRPSSMALSDIRSTAATSILLLRFKRYACAQNCIRAQSGIQNTMSYVQANTHSYKQDGKLLAYTHIQTSARMYTPHVHDVRSDDGLVVLSARDLAQVQQVPDHSDQEAVFLLLLHAATDGPDGPAQRVQGCPCPLCASELHRVGGSNRCSRIERCGTPHNSDRLPLQTATACGLPTIKLKIMFRPSQQGMFQTNTILLRPAPSSFRLPCYLQQ